MMARGQAGLSTPTTRMRRGRARCLSPIFIATLLAFPRACKATWELAGHFNLQSQLEGQQARMEERLLQAFSSTNITIFCGQVGKVPCGDQCIPRGAVCCGVGASYCPANHECLPNSTICRAICGANQQACDNGCIPAGPAYQCCGALAGTVYFCDEFRRCSAGDKSEPPTCKSAGALRYSPVSAVLVAAAALLALIVILT